MNKRRVIGCGSVTIIVMVLSLVLWMHQATRDRRFSRDNVEPLAAFVEGFRASNQRLPTASEFKEWADRNFYNKAVWYFPNKPSFVDDWGREGYDFMVGAWRGESIQYLCSWNRRTFTGEGPALGNNGAFETGGTEHRAKGNQGETRSTK